MKFLKLMWRQLRAVAGSDFILWTIIRGHTDHNLSVISLRQRIGRFDGLLYERQWHDFNPQSAFPFVDTTPINRTRLLILVGNIQGEFFKTQP